MASVLTKNYELEDTLHRFEPIEGDVPAERTEIFVDLIREVSTNLPKDVCSALSSQKTKEQDGSQSAQALSIILENIDLAYQKKSPICQDTGTVIFHVDHPEGENVSALKKDLTQAVRLATKRGYLRPNAVDSLTGKNSGDNVGEGLPSFYMEEWDKDFLQIKVMLKGGGSENVGTQYSLPDTRLNAGRDLAGIKKTILDAVYQAQGKGCAPGILGVAIGGDRVSGALAAKNQIFRDLNTANPREDLRTLEEEMLEKANSLGIGPMGFGGKTTLLGINITSLHRLPASFFVSVTYMCWAARRKTLQIKNGKYSIK